VTSEGDRIRYTWLESPVGRLLLAGTDAGLSLLAFGRGRRPARPAADWILAERPFAEAARQLRAYFAGRLREFDLPLGAEGTAFERQVWGELVRIPYGRTISYGELARRVGRPSAARAVGLANGRNPLSIVIPCHRVIGANGSLTGYGGGLETKQWLLEHEGARLTLPPS